MSVFQASARKYRPQRFSAVVGQPHITTTLRNGLLAHQIAHAYLFCGPRGVGKTTCARILAKNINCENLSPEAEACDACSSCVAFREHGSFNIFELDAASNNSVEDIRALVEQVRVPPQMGHYKVFIIDEVHMLSQSAFNAFLKTLEEPPSHAIFILATTEKHKILPTILSRCQIFDFRRIDKADMQAALREVAAKEQINVEEDALQVIMQKSEGGMRDALTLLDKLASFAQGNITYQNVIEHLDLLDTDFYFKLIECIEKEDFASALSIFSMVYKKGVEGDTLLEGMGAFLRDVLLCTNADSLALLDVLASYKDKYLALSARIDLSFLLSILSLCSEAESGYRVARDKKLFMDIFLIKLCYLRRAMNTATAVESMADTADISAVDKKKT